MFSLPFIIEQNMNKHTPLIDSLQEKLFRIHRIYIPILLAMF